MGMYQELKNSPPPSIAPQQGLLSEAAPQQGQPVPAQAVEQPQAPQEGQPQGQPQEQQQAPPQAPAQNRRNRDYETEPLGEKDRDAFDMATAISKRVIHDKESGGRESILKQLQSGQRQDPKQIVPRVAAAIFKKVSSDLKKAKIPFDPMVQTLSVAKITKEVSDLGEAAGLLPDMKKNDIRLMVADAIKQTMKNSDKTLTARSMTKAMISRLPEEEQEAARKDLRIVEATKSKTSKIPEGNLGQEGAM